jgi:phosphatidylserine synthase
VTEKIIYSAVFLLFLIGACGLTAYAFYAVIKDLYSPVFYAGIAITWGVILLVLYLVFERQDWKWWS